MTPMHRSNVAFRADLPSSPSTPAQASPASLTELEADDSVRYASPNFTVRASAVANDPLIDRRQRLGPDARPRAERLAGGRRQRRSRRSARQRHQRRQPRPRREPLDQLRRDRGQRRGRRQQRIHRRRQRRRLGRARRQPQRHGRPRHPRRRNDRRIAGNNFAASGVAPGAKIMPLRFLDGNGAGTVADAIAGIDYAISTPRRRDQRQLGRPGLLAAAARRDSPAPAQPASRSSPPQATTD